MVIGDASDAGRHKGHDGGMSVEAVDGLEVGFFSGEEGGKVLHEEHGGEEVELEGGEGSVSVDLVGGALRDKHAGDEEGEAQVGGWGAGAVIVAVGAVCGAVGDGGLGGEVEGLDIEAGGVGGREGEGVEDAGFGAGEVGAGGGDDGEGRGRGGEEVAG